jgi:hypothetical protein
MHLVTQHFYIANLACTKTKMIEKPHRNEVVTINEGAFRSINVADISDLEISTTASVVHGTLHIWIQWLVYVTNWCNCNFLHLGRNRKCK